jgi:hypothetical protein
MTFTAVAVEGLATLGVKAPLAAEVQAQVQAFTYSCRDSLCRPTDLVPHTLEVPPDGIFFAHLRDDPSALVSQSTTTTSNATASPC